MGTYLNVLKPEDVARKEIPLSEVLPAPAGGVDTGKRPPEPPLGIGHYRKFPWAKEIKAITIIPDFVVPTAEARKVLPTSYTREDIVSQTTTIGVNISITKLIYLLLQVFNLQRAVLLPAALGDSPPDPDTIFLAMQDKVHQPWRQVLIPGLTEILQSMTPTTQPGLLGICLSGAGPTILALATTRFNEIADSILANFASYGIRCQWKLLEPARDGTTVHWS